MFTVTGETRNAQETGHFCSKYVQIRLKTCGKLEMYPHDEGINGNGVKL